MLPVGFKAFVLSKQPDLDEPRLPSLLDLAIRNVHIPSIRQHSQHPNCFFTPHKVMRQLLGGDYQQYLKQTGFIQVRGDYSKSGGTTYPYRVTEEFMELLISFAAHSLEISAESAPFSPPKVRQAKLRGIASRDSRDGDHKRKTKCQIEAFIPLQLDWPTALNARYAGWVKDAQSGDISRLGAYKSPQQPFGLVAETLLLKSNLVVNGLTGQQGLITTYTESAAGRLYANGWSLQNAPKPLRQAVFTNHTEWDFEACHPAIIAGKAKEYGISCGALDFYIANRAAIRIKIAKETGLSTSEVKTAFTSVLYGARTTTFPDNALFRQLGAEGLAKISENSFFKGLQAEVNATTKALLKAHSGSQGVTNPLGKLLRNHSSVTRNQQVAHIIQGYEAFMLDTVVLALADEEGISHQVRLLLHDGWTTDAETLPALTGALEKIESQTGIDVSVDHTFLHAENG